MIGRQIHVGIKSTRWLWPLLGALLLSGCLTVGPDYIRPETPVPQNWHTKPAGEDVDGEQAALDAWWLGFSDTMLSSLLKRAKNNNWDLKKAEARIREARARRGVAISGFFPAANASGSASWSWTSDETGTGLTGDLYAQGFDASWEIDLFGGVRRSVEAAQANLEFSVEDRRDVLISLLSEVALNYVDVRIYQMRLDVADANLKTQEETNQLVVWRHQAGLADELAVLQARLNLESTRSKRPTLCSGLEEAMNRIAVLLGEHPGNLHKELNDRRPLPSVSGPVAVGVPADLLRRRPDIRKAERNLASQTAKIGVATADLYPKFKISGTLGLSASSLGGLFSTKNAIHSFGPSITIPLFEGGAIRQNIEVQSAIREQSLIAYQISVLTALEEVENALVALKEEQARKQSLAVAAAAAKEAARLAKVKYESGLTDFTDVLDAERSLLSTEDELVQSQGKTITNLIRLYKALGGGWLTATDESHR
jgi:NodT family efflux transporter outer membrane factor (OMF) lipoprotein